MKYKYAKYVSERFVLCTKIKSAMSFFEVIKFFPKGEVDIYHELKNPSWNAK